MLILKYIYNYKEGIYMFTDKANAICLLNVLKEYSDEKHILSMRDIISKMNSIYDLRPDRRTVYSAIELLQDLGYYISTYSENKKGYYLCQREFEESEIRMLTDALCSFPFIPEKHTMELIEKLQNFNSRYDRRKWQHFSVIRDDWKTHNPQIFLNIEILNEAIEANIQVSFTYLSYDINKKLVPRRSKPYIVNPYSTVYTNEHYYLFCNLTGHENTSLYRINRIKDIELLNTPTDKLPDGISVSEAVKNAIYAFTGTPEVIVFAFDKSQLNNVIDRFGTEIHIFEENERYIARLKANTAGVRFWALQYLPYVEILEPQWLRNEIIEIIKNNKYVSSADF